MKKILLFLCLFLTTLLSYSQIVYPDTDKISIERERGSKPLVPFSKKATIDFTVRQIVESALSSSYPASSTVLYVSKESDGVGTKGDISDPYPDPWAAKEAAVAGDLVWVLAGNHYTMTDTADAGDRIVINGDREWTSLMKDDVTYYFEPLTSIKNSITYSNHPMFYDTSGYTTRVLGHGTFHTVRHNTYAVVIDHEDTNFEFQADSVISNSANTGWGRGFCTSEFSTVHLDVKVWDVTNSREFHLYYPTNGDTCIDCQYTARIQYLNAKEADQLFAFPRAYWEDSNVAFDINQMEATVNYYSPLEIAGKRNSMSLNINTANIKAGGLANTYVFGHPSDTWTDSLNVASVNINSCNTEVTLAFIDNNDLNDFKQGTSLKFTGNYTHSGDSTGTNCLFFLRNVTDTSLVVTFDGTFTSHNVPIFRTGGSNSAKYYISGTYRVMDENVPVMDIDHALPNVYLLGSFFDNIGTVTPPIRASVATTIRALNAGYQTGGTLDGDVTIVNLPTY